MAIIKCKMCGGDLNLIEGASTAECEFCGSVQTIPNLDDEKKLIQFERAERLRKQCEFDKAAGIYETIVADFRQEAEAYWGLVLCKYGIEYVDDPASGKKIPTCHRSSFDSIMEDSDFEQALENADPAARKVYREEAKAIEEIRKGIIAVSANEEPYDIFICYKETAENGERTLDSVLAQDVYDVLVGKGYRVFFSRITLEDKLGVEYESYIFAALNSAKVMLAFGTDYEYFNAVWVKNEWSRFLKLMAKDKEKHLIPCYKGIDAYDMPKEFAKLQAQDLGKVGAIQDLLRGIEKLMPKGEPVKETVVVQRTVSAGNPSVESYLKRAFMFLEDGEWSSADEYCEKVLDIDPENSKGYLGKLMAELKARKQEALRDCAEPFDDSNNYQKAVRFADDQLKDALTGYTEYIKTRNENTRLEGIYSQATNLQKLGKINYVGRENNFRKAAELFASIPNYKDAAELEKACLESAETAKKDDILAAASHLVDPRAALKLFESISGWKDADEKAQACRIKIEEDEAQAKAARIRREQRAELIRKEAARTAARNKKIAIIAAAVAGVVAAVAIVLFTVILPNIRYNDAVALREAGKTAEAAMAFGALKDFKDAREQSFALWDQIAVRETISGGSYHTVGLKSDGTVVAVASSAFDQGNVSRWKDIVAVSAGDNHAVGLKSDGTVVAVGDNAYGQCNVFSWTDIVAVSAGTWHTVGLKADGTVVTMGNNDYGQCDVSDWKDIVAVSAGGQHTVGLKADGTVVATGNNHYGQCNVSGWTDIVAISAGYDHTVGLKSDGTVVATGNNKYAQYAMSGWTDIVAISAASDCTVGLKADGTVVAVGSDIYGRCHVSDWKDIVAVSAGNYHTVGLKSDGTVVAVGDNTYGECNVSGWKNIKTD